MDVLAELGADLPVIAAPMAGGPSGPALVRAAASAGALGFLAAGYKTATAVAEEIAQVRSGPYGVNLFAPEPVPVDPAAYRAYREALLPLAARYEVDLPEQPREDDDDWAAKIEAVTGAPVVTFTFGLPEAGSVRRLRAAGSLLGQTVTSVPEARLAVSAGLDLLVAQGPDAGGHSGTFTPGALPLPAAVRLPDLVREIASLGVPVIAGGGIGSPDDVRAVLDAGAAAVAVGTLLLRADEAGTSSPYRAALAGPDRGAPVLTRAYSGRPARGLPTQFMAAFDALAPLGYPAVHHLTTPIRRAAAAAGDAENINLWAGAGHRHAVEAPAAEILRGLAYP